MKRSISTFSKHFLRSLSTKTTSQNLANLLKLTFLTGGYYHYLNSHTSKAHCSLFSSSRFNFYTAAKSTIVIYVHNQDHPVAGGIILDENGLCVSVANIYPKISEERLDVSPYYAKVLGEDKIYALSFVEHIADDNIVLLRLMKKDPDIRFQPAKFTNDISIGKPSYVIGKAPLDYNIIESGIINETSFNAKSAFGKENDTSSFNIMTNIPNVYTTLYGGPLFDENGQVYGMIIPYDDRLLSSHLLVTPSACLEGIFNQFKTHGNVRRPYLGMSIKSSASGSGAFVIKLNSDGPSYQGGVKLGDTIVEINDQKITNNNDFFKCIGYMIGQTLKLKLERDGQYRFVHITST